MMSRPILLPFLRPSPLPRISFIRTFVRAISKDPHLQPEAIPLTISPKYTIEPSIRRIFEPQSQFQQKLRPQPNIQREQHPQSRPESQPRPQTLYYHLSRTPSNHLRVYQTARRGGNLKLTTLKGITGDIAALKEDLTRVLTLPEDQIKINQLTKHIVMKGFLKEQVTRFLEERQF